MFFVLLNYDVVQSFVEICWKVLICVILSNPRIYRLFFCFGHSLCSSSCQIIMLCKVLLRYVEKCGFVLFWPTLVYIVSNFRSGHSLCSLSCQIRMLCKVWLRFVEKFGFALFCPTFVYMGSNFGYVLSLRPFPIQRWKPIKFLFDNPLLLFGWLATLNLV